MKLVRDELASFISNLYFKTDFAVDSVECSRDGCTVGIKPNAGSLSWPYVALSAGGGIDISPFKDNQELVTSLLSKYDQALIEQDFASVSNYHHFYLGYLALKDERLLARFLEGMSQEYFNLADDANQIRRSGRTPMVKAERLRNIYYLFEVLDNDELFALGNQLVPHFRQAYLDEADYRKRFLAVASDVKDALVSEVPTETSDLSDVNLLDIQCWSLYGQYFY